MRSALHRLLIDPLGLEQCWPADVGAFALVQVAKRGDDRMREVVTVTLDRMMEGGIHDTIDGGFFRFSKTPDWRSPNLEKVLDANVQRMRCYLEAYQLFGTEAYRRSSRATSFSGMATARFCPLGSRW